MGSFGKGDQIVKIVFRTPEKLSRREKELYRELLELHSS